MEASECLGLLAGIIIVVIGLLGVLASLYPPAPNERGKRRVWTLAFIALSALAVTLLFLQSHQAARERKIEEVAKNSLLPSNAPSPENICLKGRSLSQEQESYQQDHQRWLTIRDQWRGPGPNPFEEPKPPDPAEFPSSKAVFFFLGPYVGFMEPTDPPKKILLVVDNKPLLWLRRTHKGFTLSADVFASDKTLILRIRDNRFYPGVKQDYSILVHDPDDPSMLAVYDPQANPLLRINFLNPFAIQINANFWGPAGTLVTITNHDINMSNMPFIKFGNGSGVCLNHLPTAPFLDIAAKANNQYEFKMH
jgi:hypothetical protein